MNKASENASVINYYADMMAMRFWVRLGREIETRGMSFRKVGAASGVDHTLISEQVRVARAGMLPSDTRLEIIDRICHVLDRPLHFFLD